MEPLRDYRSANFRLGWYWLKVKNTLAYHMAVKRHIIQALGLWLWFYAYIQTSVVVHLKLLGIIVIMLFTAVNYACGIFSCYDFCQACTRAVYRLFLHSSLLWFCRHNDYNDNVFYRLHGPVRAIKLFMAIVTLAQYYKNCRVTLQIILHLVMLEIQD